jgi:capsid portal protein
MILEYYGRQGKKAWYRLLRKYSKKNKDSIDEYNKIVEKRNFAKDKHMNLPMMSEEGSEWMRKQGDLDKELATLKIQINSLNEFFDALFDTMKELGIVENS